MIIPRKIANLIEKKLFGEPSVIILYGPRQAGKTTLITELLNKLNKENIAAFNGDDLRTRDLFGTPSLDLLKNAVGDKKYLFIDEAQNIPNIGLSLKLLFDSLKIHIIITSSASLDLADKLGEPMTGRASTFALYPIAAGEKPWEFGGAETETANRLNEFLRFGMYPKTLTIAGEDEKRQYLENYINNYLYKDVLALDTIRKPKKIIDLLSMLALQVGSRVSISELSVGLGLSKMAVEKYLDILEKMFVIINLRGFSRNLRKEINKTSKYYFTDIGVRNALIRNFNPLELRNDAGALFENWFIVEKIKLSANIGHPANFYFWRTYDQQEIDLVEERDGELFGFECKWSEKNKHKLPADWLKTYPKAKFNIVNQKNCFDALI